MKRLAVLLLAIAALPAHAATYYVDRITPGGAAVCAVPFAGTTINANFIQEVQGEKYWWNEWEQRDWWFDRLVQRSGFRVRVTMANRLEYSQPAADLTNAQQLAASFVELVRRECGGNRSVPSNTNPG